MEADAGGLCEICGKPDVCERCRTVAGRSVAIVSANLGLSPRELVLDLAKLDFDTPAPLIDPEPADPALWLVLKESDARALVGAAENGQAPKVVSILKAQPWWNELEAAVRGLRHLRPGEYEKQFPKQ